MRIGLPRKGSYSQKQQTAGLNPDAPLHLKRSTHEKNPGRNVADLPHSGLIRVAGVLMVRSGARFI